jgi:hypothetical protein
MMPYEMMQCGNSGGSISLFQSTEIFPTISHSLPSQISEHNTIYCLHREREIERDRQTDRQRDWLRFMNFFSKMHSTLAYNYY